MKPTWLAIAEDQIGTAEIPGPKSNSKIMAWAAKVQSWLGIDYTDDAVPWCGVFVAMCIQGAGYTPPKIAIRAKSWALFGEPLQDGILGAILVFERPGGGHVGFYVSETSTAYQVLGGNQSDKVGYTWIAKARCVAIRWPHGAPKTKPVRFAQAGELSQNEA